MATSCRIGALTGGLPRDEVDALTSFGRCLGMLFQLRDDVLDVIGTEEELGKLPGQDLAEGIYTLPVLKALRDPGAGPSWPRCSETPRSTGRDKARSIVAGSSAIDATVAAGRRYVQEASDGRCLASRSRSGTFPHRTGPWPARRPSRRQPLKQRRRGLLQALDRDGSPQDVAPDGHRASIFLARAAALVSTVFNWLIRLETRAAALPWPSAFIFVSAA